MNDGYQFTNDWFAYARETWPHFIPMLPENPKCLEIGSYEGRSMVWTAEHLLGSNGHLTCIDTWEGGEEHADMTGVEARFLHNRDVVMRNKMWDPLNQYGDASIGVLKGKSAALLAELIEDGETDFDFIYIDGSHVAKDVITDAVLAWQVLKPGGIMVFDDYLWGDPRDALHRPKPAIDAFTTLFAEEIQTVSVGYQYAVKKRG